MDEEKVYEFMRGCVENYRRENPNPPEEISTDDPRSPFYQGAHEAPMFPACKPNLIQLASLGIDIDLLLAGKSQF